MFRSRTGSVAIALVVGACAVLAPKDPDPTPILPTAVLETRVANEASGSFPSYEATARTFTRANMQRSESASKGGGAFARFLSSANTDARIERLDKKLAWTLDVKNKLYTECPLKGCPAPIPRQPPERKSADENRDADCRLKIGNTILSIEPTGQKRSINGFETDQYDVKWTVTFRDNASRKATSKVNIDMWTTPITPAMKDAMALEKAYARAHDKVLGIDTEPDRMLMLPPEVGRMISSYLSPNVSPTDRAVYLSGAKKLDKVKGLPIQMNVTWRFSGEACSMDETMKDIGDKPLFTFMSEVKAYKLEALHDSVFAPPKDYKRMK